MHGRLKVRTTEEQKLIKQKEQQKKLAAYRIGFKQILSTRKNDSYEPNSLNLCAQILSANPDIYTLWNYRKEVVLMEISNNDAKGEDDQSEDNLVSFCENELQLTQQCLLANPKSYGSWHHRYWILSRHPKPNWQKEFDLCNKYLSLDDRNLHVWDFRRLIVNKIGITLIDEIKFSTERINVNFSNYSSWQYRSTLHVTDEETIGNELVLVQNAVFTDPIDTSAWFYLKWILSSSNITESQRLELLEALEQLQELEPDCKWILLAKDWTNEGKNRSISTYMDLIRLDSLREGFYRDCIKNQKFVK